MATPHWEHFEHQADIGIRGFGDSLAVALEQAALAMTAVITDPALVRKRETVSIRCSESDPELLLVDWLNALVYEMATRRMLFGGFEVQLDNEGLVATARGEPMDVERHRPGVEVKGATYTELAVRQHDGEWLAQCVVDV